MKKLLIKFKTQNFPLFFSFAHDNVRKSSWLYLQHLSRILPLLIAFPDTMLIRATISTQEKWGEERCHCKDPQGVRYISFSLVESGRKAIKEQLALLSRVLCQTYVSSVYLITDCLTSGSSSFNLSPNCCKHMARET